MGKRILALHISLVRSSCLLGDGPGLYTSSSSGAEAFGCGDFRISVLVHFGIQTAFLLRYFADFAVSLCLAAKAANDVQRTAKRQASLP